MPIVVLCATLPRVETAASAVPLGTSRLRAAALRIGGKMIAMPSPTLAQPISANQVEGASRAAASQPPHR